MLVSVDAFICHIGSGLRSIDSMAKLELSRAYTVNWEFFVVGIFSYSMLCAKIKRTKLKCMRIINVNVHDKGSFVRK